METDDPLEAVYDVKMSVHGVSLQPHFLFKRKCNCSVTGTQENNMALLAAL